MDIKPTGEAPARQLPEWVRWLPIPLKLVLLILISSFFFGQTAISYALALSFFLLVWGLFDLAQSEAVPPPVRARFVWALTTRAAIVRFGTELAQRLRAAAQQHEPHPVSVTPSAETVTARRRFRLYPSGWVMLIAAVLLILNFTGLYLWRLFGWIPFVQNWLYEYFAGGIAGPVILFLVGLLAFLVRYTRFLYRQYIVHEWATVVEGGFLHAEPFYKLVESHFATFDIPAIWGSFRLASPYPFRWLGWLFLRLGRRRSCYAMEHDSYALSPYQGYLFAYPYGSSLHVVGYVMMEVGPVRRLFGLIPFIGPFFSRVQIWSGGFAEPFLNLYDRQDLIAFGSVTFGVWRAAMNALVISLNLPSKEQKIHTRGFLGITP